MIFCIINSIKIIYKLLQMNGFQLWFVYFDSLFLNPHPKITVDFYQFHVIQNATWPQSPCPALSFIYELLQSFITNKNTWNVSKCRTDQLLALQRQINDLMHLLQLQKTYAFLYWQHDSRRVEASLVHFYTYLQLLTKSVIPYPTMSLFQCNTANKLCIKIRSLERFMNQVLKIINELGLFFSSSKFQQEFAFMNNFFQNLVFFMKKLPNIKKNKLNHVHSLVKYICLTNPIQICSNLIDKSPVRKKSNTNTTKVYATQKINQNFFPRSKSLQNYKILQLPKQSYRKRSAEVFPLNQIQNRYQKRHQNLFILPAQLVNFSKQIENRNKAMTVSSLRSLTNKKESMKKMKTIQTNQTSFSYTNVEKSPKYERRYKSKSSYQPENKISPKKISEKSGSFKKERNLSLNKRENTYYQQGQRFEVLSMKSSKWSSIRRKQTSILTTVKKLSSQKKSTENDMHNGFQINYGVKENKIILKKWEKLMIRIRERRIIQQINKLSSSYKQ